MEIMDRMVNIPGLSSGGTLVVEVNHLHTKREAQKRELDHRVPRIEGIIQDGIQCQPVDID